MLVDLARLGPDETVRAAARRYRVPERRIAADLDQLLAELPPGLGTGVAPRRDDRVDRLALVALSGLRRARPPRLRVWLLLAAARGCFATAGWWRTLGWWTAAPARGGPPRASATEIDARVRRCATGSVLGHTCKERAVVCLAEARAAGLGAAVVLGVSFYPLATHSWCVLDDGVVLGDHAEVCGAFSPAVVHR